MNDLVVVLYKMCIFFCVNEKFKIVEHGTIEIYFSVTMKPFKMKPGLKLSIG